MNITEQIAELIRQGKTVELPGVGAISAEPVAAHFDSETKTFYPTRLELKLRMANGGGVDMAKLIAEKECVSNATGAQMWRNYIDALMGKIEKEGEIEIPHLATLKRENGMYSLVATKEFTANGNPAMMPIEDVPTYTHTGRDPFAVFEGKVEEPVAAPVIEPEPVVEPVVVPEPVVEIPAEEIPAEEPVAEPEPIVEPKPIVEPEPVVEVPAPVAEPVAEVAPEPEPVVETPAPIAEPAVEPAPAEEPVPAQEEPKADALEELNALENLQQSQPDTTPEKKKKKSKAWIWILLLLLLACGGGAAYYFLVYSKANPQEPKSNLNIEEMVSGSEGNDATPDEEFVDSIGEFSTADVDQDGEGEIYGESSEEDSAAETTTDEEVAVAETAEEETVAEEEKATETKAEQKSVSTSSSFLALRADLLEFSAEDIAINKAKVASFMSEYVAAFAKEHKYSKATDALVARVEEYAGQRLEELLAPAQFSAARFLPKKDYEAEYNETCMKNSKATKKRCEVQTELMDDAMMSQLLNEVVAANGIEEDAAVAVQAQPAQKSAPSTAQYYTSSKKGFDVIAGFYTNKSTADRMATQLKRQGCGAYIIEINHGYYVSMGSAESRTKAEALYAHLKEWYTGDMSIKKF